MLAADTASAQPTALDIEPFVPPPWLRSPHTQSVLPSLKLRRPLLRRRARQLLAVTREHILDCGDGVRLMGLASLQPGDEPRPMAMLLHGWEGSADSLYMLALGSSLYARGYHVFRLNFRDHGPTHHLNRDIFHSCRLPEVVGAVRAVQDVFAPQSLSMAGFSLGGNFCLRVAAKAPQAGIRLKRVVAVCPVLSPKSTLRALEDGWFVYQQYFIGKWKNSLRIKQRCFPDRYNFADILRMKSLAHMTDVLVRRHSEYTDMSTYLDGYAIVGDVLAGLTVPSHVLLAAQDPIIPAVDAPQLAQSGNLAVQVMPHGGHCGFIDKLSGEGWMERNVARLLAG
jgi:uncharacterized protein